MRVVHPYLRFAGLLLFLSLLVFLIVVLLNLFVLSFSQFLSGSFFAPGLLNNVANPFIAIIIGGLLSILVRSSSIFITLLAAIVIAGFPFASAIYMVLGANIGTTFQSSLTKVLPDARVNDKRRMMTISCMHYFNNIIAFAIFFPLQISTDFLGRSSQWMAQWFDGLIFIDTQQMSLLMQPLSDFFPIITHSILMLLLFTAGIFFLMRVFFVTLRLVFDPVVEQMLTRQIEDEKAEESVLLSGVVTAGLLQSSSSTIYILMPLVRKITCNIPLIYSLILGMNVGTCFTTILFALLLQSEAALSIGLAHLIYNFIALLIFTYVPLLKELPILASKHLALCSYCDLENQK
ncbi:MAG: hypothetical protein OQL19_13275 [Gammaproteobacteria bacterium]|nr:hypothetical protein [Gammaproteobacteria bacterium]